MQDDITIGGRIRHWRNFTKIRPAQLARMVGVTQPAVSRWEDGASHPTMQNLIRVADAFGVSLRVFFGPLPGGESAGTGED